MWEDGGMYVTRKGTDLTEVFKKNFLEAVDEGAL